TLLVFSEGSACNVCSSRCLRSSSDTCIAFSCSGATTCSKLRTPCTPSTFRAMVSAFACSSAECTLPYRVTRPATVSTLMAVPLTPSVVNRDNLILAVIQASGVAAPAGAASAAPSTTAMTLYLIHIHDGRCMILLLDRKTLNG